MPLNFSTKNYILQPLFNSPLSPLEKSSSDLLDIGRIVSSRASTHLNVSLTILMVIPRTSGIDTSQQLPSHVPMHDTHRPIYLLPHPNTKSCHVCTNETLIAHTSTRHACQRCHVNPSTMSALPHYHPCAKSTLHTNLLASLVINGFSSLFGLTRPVSTCNGSLVELLN